MTQAELKLNMGIFLIFCVKNGPLVSIRRRSACSDVLRGSARLHALLAVGRSSRKRLYRFHSREVFLQTQMTVCAFWCIEYYSKKLSYRTDSARFVKRPLKVTQGHLLCQSKRYFVFFVFYLHLLYFIVSLYSTILCTRPVANEGQEGTHPCEMLVSPLTRNWKF